MEISQSVRGILVCPQCSTQLEVVDAGAHCAACETLFTYARPGQLDLRLKRPKEYSLTFSLGTPLLPSEGMRFEPLRRCPAPEIDLAGRQMPDRLSSGLASYFPRAGAGRELMLDLGCGNQAHRSVCELTGYEYVGVDIDAPNAPLLADAHALPFQDESFAFVLSIAVMEHVRNPFVMAREAWRVLKPGGRLIGTVSFLEPFHIDSFYHQSHLGVLNLLQSTGFAVDVVAPSKDWDSLRAQASMALFLRMPERLSHAIVAPVRLLNRLWYRLGYLVTRSPYATEYSRILANSGAQTFIAHKPGRTTEEHL